MRYITLLLVLLALLACKRETTTVRTLHQSGQVRVQGTLANQPVDVVVEGQHQAQEQERETSTTASPIPAGPALSALGKALSLAGSSGLLGPYGALAGLAGTAVSAAAGYFMVRKKNKHIGQLVQGVEDYKRNIPEDEVEALHGCLGRQMDSSAKESVRRYRKR